MKVSLTPSKESNSSKQSKEKSEHTKET